MARKVFFGNYKGGVGKTTCTYQIALRLAGAGKNILLIDLDPQSSLSSVCLSSVSKTLEDLPHEKTLNFLYEVNRQAAIQGIRADVSSSQLVQKTKYEHLNFIANSLIAEVGGLDSLVSELNPNLSSLVILRDFIINNDLDKEYDYIFFDCPPSNNIITQSAFLLSDYYIIPTIMDPLSRRGVEHYCKVVEKIYEKYCDGTSVYPTLAKHLFGDKPALLGVFESMRRETATQVENDTRNTLEHILGPDKLFNSIIGHLKEVKDAMGDGRKASGLYKD
ncbi:MAG: AAA family ATPase, partial [Candidatus Adiutrix sp.]|nr:AAA family ATPase [Candidatus Adiutrix sp.]